MEKKWISLTCALTILLICRTISVGAARQVIDTKRYKNLCVKRTKNYAPIADTDKRAHAILKLGIEVSTLLNIQTIDSPQHNALCWMIYDDKRKPDPRGSGRAKFLDRYALVTLYMNTKGPGWIRSDHWLSKESECSWYGVTCSRPGYLSLSYRVSNVDISFNKLTGIIPREMAYLTELRELDLNGNSLQGVLPHLMLASLTKLEKLHLHMNDLFGAIPKEIGNLKKLQELTLFGNFFFGSIPDEISNLKNLRVFDIYANNLTGKIPSSLGNLKSLSE